jgi:hypothetical protein
MSLKLNNFTHAAIGGVFLLAILLSASVYAAETTVLVISDSSGTVTGEFLGGTCGNKYMGTGGCLKMKKNRKNKKFKIFFSDETEAENWDWTALEIRMPFNNWNDPVDPDVLDDLSITGPPSFNANGHADLTALGGPVLMIMDKNDHAFIVQYRIKVSNGDAADDFWIHPVFENEGID